MKKLEGRDPAPGLPHPSVKDGEIPTASAPAPPYPASASPLPSPFSSRHPFLLKAEYVKREPHEDSLKVIVKAHHILPIYQASLKDRIKNFHHKGFRTGHPPKALRMKLSDEVKEDVLPAVAMNVLQQIQHLLDPPPSMPPTYSYEPWEPGQNFTFTATYLTPVKFLDPLAPRELPIDEDILPSMVEKKTAERGSPPYKDGSLGVGEELASSRDKLRDDKKLPPASPQPGKPVSSHGRL